MAETDSKDTVASQRAEYEKNAPTWEKIMRVVDYDDSVSQYIHDLNPGDQSEAMKNRRDEFKKRAVFSAVTSYTIEGFNGIVFEQEPKIDLPKMLEYLNENIDGTGIGIIQQAQSVEKHNLSIGRGALWTDFPATNGKSVTMKDLRDGRYFATIQHIEAKDIFFWDHIAVGSEIVLSEVRFHSTKKIRGEFSLSHQPCIVRLFLNSSMKYTIQKWIKNDKGEWIQDGNDKMPKGGDGKFLTRIPFEFYGSETNNWRIDAPPAKRLAYMNLAHYNNSAIYEDAVLKASQPQPWMSGYTQDQLEELKQKHWYIGSGYILGVPTNQRFEFAQARESGMGRQAMLDKLDVMVGMGAMYVIPRTATKTAAQANNEERSRTSIISIITNNTSDAFQRAIRWAGVFMNEPIPKNQEIFRLNSSFVEPDADYNMIREMIAGFLQGALPPKLYHDWLKRNKLADPEESLEDFQAQLSIDSTGELDLDDESMETEVTSE